MSQRVIYVPAIADVNPPVIEGLVIERDFTTLAEGMVELLTEFDFAPGHENSIPDDLRERLLQWCADLDTWDRRTHESPPTRA